MRAAIFIFCGVPLLAACDLGDYTESGFRSATASGIPVALSNELNGSLAGPSGEVHYVSGTDEDGAHAFSGILNVGSVGIAPSTNMTYTTLWETVGIGNISVSDDYLTGYNQRDSGSMLLEYDSATGRVTGSDAGTHGTLTVNGNLSGTDLGGAVSYAGVAGTLDGVAGTTGLIGAFHGSSEDRVYAGGLRSISVAP